MLIYQDRIHLSVSVYPRNASKRMRNEPKKEVEMPKDRAQLTDYHSDELETAPVCQLQLIHFGSLKAHLTLLLWT